MVSQSQSLGLRQSQNLVMSPQMQQSLKILQLSTIDLSQLIENELQNNPLLEKTEEIDENDNQDENTQKTEKESDSFDEATSDELNSDRNSLDADFDNNWSSNEYKSPNSGSGNSNSLSLDDAGSIIERTYTKELSLKEHLIEQVNLDFEDIGQKIIAAHLIDLVDSSGYLPQEKLALEKPKIMEILRCSGEEIDATALRLKSLDPTGICSANLGECLQTQLQELNRLDPAIGILIENLDLLAKGELKKLQRLCGVDEEDLKEMILEIKALNPRPASNFSEDEAQTKYPDLILVKKNNVWLVDLNMEMMPKINVKRDFYYKMKSATKRKEDKKFLSENLASANFLVQAISRRTETVLKVAIEIIKEQQEFFEKGINYLKPISMKDIAEKVEMHESTVGRVVSNKYITTPRGVFELKYFFSNSLSATFGGKEFSTETVRHRIKELIENEDKVLSDDKISSIMKEKGVNVARRTVAKYREAMGIPTSADRKRSRKLNM